jgi:hypothetical protein
LLWFSLLPLAACPAQLGRRTASPPDLSLIPLDVTNDLGPLAPHEDAGDSGQGGDVPDLSTPPTVTALRVGLFEAEDYQAEAAKAAAHALAGNAAHANNVRTIFSVYHYTDQPNVTSLVAFLKTFKNEGFHTTVTISGSQCKVGNCADEPTSAAQFSTYMANFYTAMGSNIQYVDAIEVWNEWDKGYGHLVNGQNVAYTPTQYVQWFLQPAATQIKAHAGTKAVELIAGSVVEGSGVNDLKNLVAEIAKLGVDKYPDAFAFHPYATNWAGLASSIAAAEAVVASTGKPLALTEWGCDPAWESCSNMNQLLTDAFNPKTGLASHKISEADYYLLSLSLSEAPYGPIVLVNDDASNSHGVIFNAYQTGAAQLNP